MMIKIQINLSLPFDGSFVAHSTIIRIQKTVPANESPYDTEDDECYRRNEWADPPKVCVLSLFLACFTALPARGQQCPQPSAAQSSIRKRSSAESP
jgi:hypothetical protein